MPRNVVFPDSAIYNAGRDQYNHTINGGVHNHHHHHYHFYCDYRREDLIVLSIVLVLLFDLVL